MWGRLRIDATHFRIAGRFFRQHLPFSAQKSSVSCTKLASKGQDSCCPTFCHRAFIKMSSWHLGHSDCSALDNAGPSCPFFCWVWTIVSAIVGFTPVLLEGPSPGFCCICLSCCCLRLFVLSAADSGPVASWVNPLSESIPNHCNSAPAHSGTCRATLLKSKPDCH